VIQDAKKETITAAGAWELINSVEKVVIGKGKKILNFKPLNRNKEEILKNALGRTGNLRAPAIKAKGALFIGYNDTIYDSL